MQCSSSATSTPAPRSKSTHHRVIPSTLWLIRHDVSPLRLARYVLNFIKCVSQLDNRVPDHPRILAQRLPDRVLCFRRAVEPHDEVVACLMQFLMLARRFGEQEGAPVRDAPDDAAGVEDDVASGTGDTKRVEVSSWRTG